MNLKKLIFSIVIAASVLPAGAEVMTDPAPEVEANAYALNIEGANNDNTAAARVIGDCYLTGKGGAALDPKQAWKWYAKAAGKGDLEARYRIACLYRDGKGVAKNDREAAYWFGRAAANGHALAQLNIADCYANGRGIQSDQRIASENYWRAADRGVAEAAYMIAIRLRDGIGVSADQSQALKFFKQAAQANFADAAEQAKRLEDQGVKMPVKPSVARASKPATSGNAVKADNKKKNSKAPSKSNSKKGKGGKKGKK